MPISSMNINKLGAPRDFPGGSEVKRLPTMRETWVRFLGQEDLLEKDMATHSSTLAWKIPWTEEPGRLQSMGLQRVRHNRVTSLLHHMIKNFWSTYKSLKKCSPKLSETTHL